MCLQRLKAAMAEVVIPLSVRWGPMAAMAATPRRRAPGRKAALNRYSS
jgi:hypothetical protein